MLGEQIKKLRLARNMSQVALANQLGVTKQSVSNWENDNILPSLDMLKKIAQYFSCTTDYLLELEGEKLYIETSNLTLTQISHIQLIIEDFKALNSIIQK